MPDSRVFDARAAQNEASWKFLITGYMRQGKPQKALAVYKEMPKDHDSTCPSKHTFVALLKACAKTKDLRTGSEVHAKLARTGWIGRDVFIGSSLIDMYAKCGKLDKAQKVFDKLVVRNVVCWNALLRGYVEHEQGMEALNLLTKMRQEAISPDAVTFICILKACGSTGEIAQGREVHAEIERKGLLEKGLVIGNSLIDMYAKCGLLSMAQEVFDKLLTRDVVSWTSLIAGYVEHGAGEDALKCLAKMVADNVPCNVVTYVCALKACSSIGACKKGQEIHSEIEKNGILETNLLLGNALLDMYAKCGLLPKAQEVFDRIPVRDVVSWTSIIAGYTEHGHGQEALNTFELMDIESVCPDIVTFLCVLKACGHTRDMVKGREIHAKVEKQGLLQTNILLGNALVDMYAKCGSLTRAREVFDGLPSRSLVSWNALMSGYAEQGQAEETIHSFERMHLDGVSPDGITFVCILKSCASLGATSKGTEIHVEIERQGLIERDVLVGSTLVDMYARCGSLMKARQVFDKLPVRDVVAWTAIMEGYAHLGDSTCVFASFDRMITEGIHPDPVTFIILLNTCSRAGFMGKGQTYYEAMIEEHGISPSLQHHGCMVDLLVRGGHVDKAISRIENLPSSSDLVAWRTVLSACRSWGNIDLAKQAFKSMVLH